MCSGNKMFEHFRTSFIIFLRLLLSRSKFKRLLSSSEKGNENQSSFFNSYAIYSIGVLL